MWTCKICGMLNNKKHEICERCGVDNSLCYDTAEKLYTSGQEPVRIGITGSHGTGKSTLAKALSEELNIPLITEQARKAAKVLNLDKPPEAGTALSTTFQSLCLHLQLESEQLHTSFVSDRTTIDNALYYLMNNRSYNNSFFNLQYFTTCEKNVKNYDLIIYTPIEFDLQDDGFRDTDKHRQLEADYLIQCLLAKMRPDNFITVRGSTLDRIEQVMSYLKGEI